VPDDSITVGKDKGIENAARHSHSPPWCPAPILALDYDPHSTATARSLPACTTPTSCTHTSHTTAAASAASTDVLCPHLATISVCFLRGRRALSGAVGIRASGTSQCPHTKVEHVHCMQLRKHAHKCLSQPTLYTSAYVSMRQHASAGACLSAYVSIRQHTSAYVSIRQHTSAYVSIRQHTSASAYVSIRDKTSAYVSIRQHMSAYVTLCVCVCVCVCV
jgi:hypothetical protein